MLFPNTQWPFWLYSFSSSTLRDYYTWSPWTRVTPLRESLHASRTPNTNPLCPYSRIPSQWCCKSPPAYDSSTSSVRFPRRTLPALSSKSPLTLSSNRWASIPLVTTRRALPTLGSAPNSLSFPPSNRIKAHRIPLLPLSSSVQLQHHPP